MAKDPRKQRLVAIGRDISRSGAQIWLKTAELIMSNAWNNGWFCRPSEKVSWWCALDGFGLFQKGEVVQIAHSCGKKAEETNMVSHCG